MAVVCGGGGGGGSGGGGGGGDGGSGLGRSIHHTTLCHQQKDSASRCAGV